jgi:DNA-binding LacI/PurR family transcriptional regulator
MRTAILELVKRGYRRPGLLVHRDIVEASDNRWAAGFLSKQEDFPEIGPEPIFSPDNLIRERLLAPLKEWIERNRLDVVICGSDAWLLRWLEELGYRVPEDLGLCCLDLIKPDGRVTGFDQHPRQLGRSAATILNSLLLTSEFGPLEFPTSTHLAAQWVEGTTLPFRQPATKERGP